MFEQPTRETLPAKKLSEADIVRIEELCSSKEAFKDTLLDLISNLEEGHPMNRIIRSLDGNGQIIKDSPINAFLGCMDIYEGEEKPTLYIKYLFSNNESVKDLRTEVKKLMRKAKKEGYQKITFNGFNDRLNQFAERIGFRLVEENSYAPRYEIDLTDEKQIVYEQTRHYLETDPHAKEILAKLSEEEKIQIDTLVKNHIYQGLDPEAYNLYGAIDTLKKNQIDILKLGSLSRLFLKAREINNQQDLIAKRQEYAHDLLTELEIENPELEQEIALILNDNNPSKWDTLLKQALTSRQILLPKETLTETYLSGLNTREPLTHIADLKSANFPYSLYTLNSKKEMQNESAMLGHCVGNSDYYLEKVKNGEIKVISVRDSSGRAHWTIEYNLKSRRIEQFKGEGDQGVNSLPNSEEVVTAVLEALENNHYPITSISEKFEYALYFDGNEAQVCYEESALRKICQAGETRVLKGEITAEADWSTSEILKLCSIEGLTLDLTAIPPEIKNEITEIKGDLVDKSINVDYEKLTRIGGYASFDSLTTLEGLNALMTIGENASFHNLTTLEGLNALTTIEGNASFYNLTTLEGLNALTTISGWVSFNSLTTLEGLNALTTIGGGTYFGSLTTLEGLNALTTIGGYASFDSLTTLEGLNALTTIGGEAYFWNLTTLEGLNALTTIGGQAYFNSLTTLEGLQTLTKVGGLVVDKLNVEDKNRLLEQIGTH